MSATTSLPWSIHLTGSDSILVRPSTRIPPTNKKTDEITSAERRLGRQAAELDDESLDQRSSSPLRSAPSIHGCPGRSGQHDADVTSTTRRSSTAHRSHGSSAPSRSAAPGRRRRRRARRRSAAAPGWPASRQSGVSLSSTTSSSTRLWIWIAKSIPSPIRIGRPEIVTSDRSMPDPTQDRERPDHADSTASSGSRRQRTRNMTPARAPSPQSASARA